MDVKVMTPAEYKATLLYHALTEAEKDEWTEMDRLANAEHKKMHPWPVY